MTATALAYDLNTDFFNADFVSPPPRLAVIAGGGETPIDAPALHPTIETFRRRRFLAVLALTVAVVVFSQLAGLSLTSFGPIGESTRAPGVEASTPVVHVVAPGDTYGGIAASMGADDPATFAITLQDMNRNAELVVGQRLVVDRAALAAAGQ